MTATGVPAGTKVSASAEVHSSHIRAAMGEFLATQDRHAPISTANLRATYTESTSYLMAVICQFHAQMPVLKFTDRLMAEISAGATVVDVGCAGGITGLTLAREGFRVTFHDFEGLGLDFVRHYAAREGLDVRVVPYGEEPAGFHHDWAVALDVIEHTGNELGFLRWMKQMGDTVAFSIPTVGFEPPYRPVVDAWIDREAVEWVVRRRYEVLYWQMIENRTFVVFR